MPPLKRILLYPLLVLLLVACSASERNKGIASTFITVTTLDAKYSEYQAKHQHDVEQDIVMAAADKASGEVALAAYRKKRNGIDTAFKVAYQAIAAAAAINNDPSFASMLAALQLLQQAVADMGVKL